MPLPAAPQQTFLPILPAPMENPPTWMSSMPIMPSSLTNPDIHPIRPVAKASNSGRVKPPKQTPNPARVRLQDHQRKDMCIFHAKYPEVKQAQIGKMFGVERSTVSKILRLTNKYLSDERSVSPAKRPKARVQNVEMTISNWVLKQESNGRTPTDDEIIEQAKKYASGVSSHDDIQTFHTAEWLEEFRQTHKDNKKQLKRNRGAKLSRAVKLSRRSSETNMSDIPAYDQRSAGSSIANTPSGQSPSSSFDFASPHSAIKDEDDYPHFLSNGYRHSNSRSTTSLSSNLTDTTVGSSFSGGASSPATPFSFSPETTQGPFQPPNYVRALAPSYPQRPRSQTFPTLTVDPDTATTATFPHHSASPPSVDGEPPVTTPATTASTASVSPTQDDARLALETFLNYMEASAPQGLVDEFERQTVIKLTERMRQHSLGSIGQITDVDAESESMECSMSVGV
ncbi:hypothetical protein V490_05875 [Pseudogymnoascus sp. VKM F-3557]|nr:hypothetical protein V490_05875 [Pseudogymnoascus sp. VKM F-3557]